MDEDEARRRFALGRVARLATVSGDGKPHVVPCTFAVDEDKVYVAVDHKPKTTTRLKRLANIAANPSVTMIVDYYDDEDWTALWWVRADGQASVITDPAVAAGPIELLAARYPQYRDVRPDGPVIAITVTRWSSWSAS
ncbi:MAG TPA: TIGR03668 family PPOX class F420-dependent oxidoreductase [Streptosporangiaceae bacterium]|jgi:PPOX class probable F420-dependent enzyme|nr:TIGR03668 family PPOX class F420-dependent oxidoreductase [Streptosporangiaceae bacterium]